MTLDARDELRHVPSDDPLWRESLYWNFNDPEQNLGAWIYIWVSPGPPAQSGIIVSFYSGYWPDSSVFSRAMVRNQPRRLAIDNITHPPAIIGGRPELSHR
jgi:hypothetical protein